MQVVLTVAGSSYISFQRAGITGLCQNTQLPHWIQCIQESWVAQLARSLSVSSLRQPTFYRLPLCLCAISVWIILCCCDKIPSPNAIHRTRFILAYISRWWVHYGSLGRYGSMQPKQGAKRHLQLKTQSRKTKQTNKTKQKDWKRMWDCFLKA
jgi:hypothetical protein